MLETFSTDLDRCAMCHDQCLFATTEVFATGRQTLATSRKAMLLKAVLHGQLDWTPSLVDVVYSGLSSGVQHAVCVHHGDPAGWPDETEYLRAARAVIVRAGLAPQWAGRLRDAWRKTGNPYGLLDDKPPSRGEIVFFFDAATRALHPEVQSSWTVAAEALNCPVGKVASGSSGFELFDLGFVEEAQAAAQELNALFASLRPRLVVSDSPEAVYMIARIWPRWGILPAAPAKHASEWLAELLRRPDVSIVPDARGLTFHDPACLARYLRVTEEPRYALRRLGVELVEMLRHGEEALPAGSYYGEAVGIWARAIPAERAASARAVGAEGIVTASPFDYRNLQGLLPVVDLGEIAALHLEPRPSVSK